jgi:hypothetical protein
MYLRSICLYLRQKDSSTIDIHKDIEATFGRDEANYSAVREYMRGADLPRQRTHSSLDRGQASKGVDGAILTAFVEKPSESVRGIASKSLIPRTTVRRQLVGPLEMIMKCLRWVPRKLLEDYHYPFFDIHIDYEQTWIITDEAPETRERYMASSAKLMITIAWNPDALDGIKLLSKKEKFNADSSSSVLTGLSKIARQFRSEMRRKLIAHADNAIPHPQIKD